MSIYGGKIPGANGLASITVSLSKQARQKLKWFDYYHSHGNNAQLTCRHFVISPQTFYRWRQRFNPRHLRSSILKSPLVSQGTGNYHLELPGSYREGKMSMLLAIYRPLLHRCAFFLPFPFE